MQVIHLPGVKALVPFQLSIKSQQPHHLLAGSALLSSILLLPHVLQ